jgi:hypothetical protein
MISGGSSGEIGAVTLRVKNVGASTAGRVLLATLFALAGTAVAELARRAAGRRTSTVELVA